MNKTSTLANKLTYQIMAVVFTMMAIITGIVYFQVRKAMTQEAEDQYMGILNNTHETLRRVLSDVSTGTINNIHDIERDIDHPELLYDHMERIVKNNEKIKACGLLFEPGYYPNEARHFVPHATRNSAGEIIVRQIGEIYNIYDQQEWYKKAMSKDAGDWTNAYFENSSISVDPDSMQLLVTYADFIHDKQGRKIGLICSDLSLKWLQERIAGADKKINDKFEYSHRHKSYSFIIDQNGTYIIHPDTKRMLSQSFISDTQITPDSLDDRIVASMIKGKTGTVRMVVDGVPSWVYYDTVKSIEWSIAIVVPESIIFDNSTALNTIILITMLFGLAAIYFICRSMIRKTTRPLHVFAKSADQVALGNFNAPLPDIKSHDEVLQLHDAFKNMQQSLSTYVDELQKTTATKASIEHELKIAHDIQMALLPKIPKLNEQLTDASVYSTLTPARDVGGDLYDTFVNDGRLYFCIGDVSGKGMPAALVMALTRAMFRSEARHADRAATVLRVMNNNVCAEKTTDIFVTLFVGILDLATGHLDYSNAGHDAPLLSGNPLPVNANIPIGVLGGWDYQEQEAQLNEGDLLFLYTDGITEAMNPAGEQFGKAHLRSVVQQNALLSPQQLIELIEAAVHAHADTAPQSDDITMLALQWIPSAKKD